MATDWAALKVEYITVPITLRELAKKHNIKAAGLMARSAKEKWEDERKQHQAELSKKAITESLPDRVEQLSKFNEEDLRVACAIRELILKQIEESGGNMPPSQIKSLSGASLEAQKIGRLALGAETENATITTRSLEPLPDDAFLG